MAIKVVFAPETGRLLGAQIVGYDGVDKRIDQFARVIKEGGGLAELIRTEHAYAPPYSSAKDPVALAGYVASNILTGKMNPIYWRELRDMNRDKIALIDVRTPEEFATGGLDGAVNIPLDDMREMLDKIPADKPIVLYCGVGLQRLPRLQHPPSARFQQCAQSHRRSQDLPYCCGSDSPSCDEDSIMRRCSSPPVHPRLHHTCRCLRTVMPGADHDAETGS